MSNLEAVLKNYVDGVNSSKVPEIVIPNIRSFLQLITSPPFQSTIVLLNEEKHRDLQGFQKAFEQFQIDKKNAFCAIKEFVEGTPFLKKHLPDQLFAQHIPGEFIFFEPSVVLNIRGFNEDLHELMRAILDYGYLDFVNKFVEIVPFSNVYLGTTEKPHNPLRVACLEYELGAFVFSKALDECCREADILRGKKNTVLWSDLDELLLFYDWTKNGLPSLGYAREFLLRHMQQSHIMEKVNRVYGYILENRYFIMQECASEFKIDAQKFNPRSIIDLQLFFDESSRNIWIIGRQTNGGLTPLFLSQIDSQGGRFKLMQQLKNADPGTTIEHEDLARCRNRIGLTKKNGLLKVFFKKNSSGKGCDVYRGATVRLTTEDKEISLETIFTTLLELQEKQELLEKDQQMSFPFSLYYSNSKYF